MKAEDKKGLNDMGNYYKRRRFAFGRRKRGGKLVFWVGAVLVLVLTLAWFGHGGGLKSVYLGLIENAAVRKGQEVTAGEVLGAVSASSLFESLEQVHLHLEMTVNGRRVDPLDYLPA